MTRFVMQPQTLHNIRIAGEWESMCLVISPIRHEENSGRSGGIRFGRIPHLILVKRPPACGPKVCGVDRARSDLTVLVSVMSIEISGVWRYLLFTRAYDPRSDRLAVAIACLMRGGHAGRMRQQLSRSGLYHGKLPIWPHKARVSVFARGFRHFSVPTSRPTGGCNTNSEPLIDSCNAGNSDL